MCPMFRYCITLSCLLVIFRNRLLLGRPSQHTLRKLFALYVLHNVCAGGAEARLPASEMPLAMLSFVKAG